MAIVARQTVTVIRTIHRDDLLIEQGATGSVSSRSDDADNYFWVDFGRKFSVRFAVVGDERSRCLRFGRRFGRLPR